jgi:hypothetical protein
MLSQKFFLEWLVLATPIPDLCADLLSNGSVPLHDSRILEGVAHLRDLCFLVHFALFVEPRRSLRQPLPTLAQLAFQPKRMQSFLRGCVDATARRLATAPASGYVDAMKTMIWRHRIFARVMKGLVTREEMQLQATAAARISGKCGIAAAAESGDVADVLSYLITHANCVDEFDR